jgi:long-chain acyl-CoA synthetase
VVVPRGEVEEAELLAHCRALIAGYKLPKRIELRSQPLPKSAAGKVLKRELRAPYWVGRETMVSGA